MMKTAYFYLIFYLVYSVNAKEELQTQQLLVDSQRVEDPVPELPADLRALYMQLFDALVERDIQVCPRLFGTFDFHQAAFSKSRAEYALEKSFSFAQRDYLSDCRTIMDQFPKVGDTLKAVKFDLSRTHVEQIDEKVMITSGVVIKCRYGTSLARLTFAPPPAVLVEKKWRFIDRFNKLARFQYLDPATGE